jgi:gamma-glutamyltranspeptidase / glutathione hydrolase / leukotriene-C4 hydrolase
VAIDAREAAPSNAHQRLFVDGTPAPSSVSGGLAIGIPGEVAGFWKAHKRYGRLPWSALFKPAIDMCNEGIVVQKALAFTILKNKSKLYADKSMR